MKNKLYCVRQSAASSYGTSGEACEFGFLVDEHVDDINGTIKVFVGVGSGSAIDRRRSAHLAWVYYLFSTKPEDISLYKETHDWKYISKLNHFRECTEAEVESFKQAVQYEIEKKNERVAELKSMLKRVS